MAIEKTKQLVQDLATSFCRGDIRRIKEIRESLMDLWTEHDEIPFNDYKDLEGVCYELESILARDG